jgi:hypothetical protein
MQRTAVLRRISRMRFDVGLKSNLLTAIGDSTQGIAAHNSRGVEAAMAASTHAVSPKRPERTFRMFHRSKTSLLKKPELRNFGREASIVCVED